MQSFYARSGSVYIFGARFPTLVFALASAILVCSILGAMLTRNGVPLLEMAAFIPAAVRQGQVWRLFTWPFFETGLLSLVFGVLIMLFFGRDLYYAWGARRFLAVMLLMPAAAAFLTTLLSPVLWREVRTTFYLGTSVLMDILVVAWATLFPARQILLYFVLPVGGRVLVYLTIGITVLVGLLYGLHNVVPHFLALGLILLYLHGVSWGRFRTWFRKPGGRGPTRRPPHLRPVERGEPPRWLH
jgi:membrane associated rhomboid family serine protease